MEDILNIAIEADIDIDDAILYHILNYGEDVAINEQRKFNLADMSENEVKLNFRFEKKDIPILREALKLPNNIRTATGNSVTSTTALCILLRRLAYPNRLKDLTTIFGMSSQSLSQIINHTIHFLIRTHGSLLNNLENVHWLNKERMRNYAQAIRIKGGAVPNSWGFIDGTTRQICRPSLQQEEYFSGHKRYHCVKYQSVLCPDGIIVSLKGAYIGRRHDAGIFRNSGLYTELERVAVFQNEEKYVLYGDQAYGIRELLLCPYPGRRDELPLEHRQFNASMCVLRTAVEWGFQKIITQFAFLDYRKNQKLLLQDVESMYKIAVILTNCHTCLYGSQTGTFFNVAPPSLLEYIG